MWFTIWLQVGLLTGCTLLLCASVWYARVAATAASDAEDVEQRLLETQGTVAALVAAVDKLSSAHRSLAGRVYADEYWRGKRDAQPELQLAAGVPPSPMPSSSCANWSLAQELGPRSEAAACQCGYCSWRRAERERQRAQIVPKTARGQGELAKLNAGKP